MPRAEIESARTIAAATRIAGELAVPGDKSIAHRALILASLAQGESWIHGLPEGEDVLATLACLRGLGANIQRSGRTARIRGTGLSSFATPRPGDHAERLLRAMGTDVGATGDGVVVRPSHQPLRPIELAIPGDFSSAAFWMAAAALQPGWSVIVGDVGLNPTRTAFLTLLRSMGADVKIEGPSGDVEPP